MIKLILLGALISVSFSARSGSPEGWIKPKTVNGNDFCTNYKSRFEAKGDFDGDGKSDTAKILANLSTKNIGVWVWLSTESGPILALEDNQSKDGEHDMLIASNVKPGKYVAACAKGYGKKCQKGELSSATLKSYGIEYFECEGSKRILFWNSLQRKFDSIWIFD